MNVFIVTSNHGYDSNNFEGAFSTKELAEEYIEKTFGKDTNVAEWSETELDKP